MTITIYGLVDPRDSSVVRYVGQTANPMQRHLTHCGIKACRTAKQKWVEAMRKDGFMPQMIVLEVTAIEHANSRESHWQKHYSATLFDDTIQGCTRVKYREPRNQDGKLRAARRNVDKAWIESAICNAGGNISEAASVLGISRPTLYDQIAMLGIALPSKSKRKRNAKGYHPVKSQIGMHPIYGNGLQSIQPTQQNA